MNDVFNTGMVETDIVINGVKQLVPRWAITSQELAKQAINSDSRVSPEPPPTDIDLLAQAYKEGVNEA